MPMEMNLSTSLNVKLLKVNGSEGKLSVEFTKESGSQVLFYSVFEMLK